MSKIVNGYEMAVKILKSTKGISVNEKSKIQTWSFGKIYSDKVVNAGKFLDKYNIETNGEFKTIWLDKNGEIPVCFGSKK